MDIRPTETGVESFAQAGRRIGAFYNQAGEAIATAGARLGRAGSDAIETAENYETHKEVAAGAAKGAQLFADQLEKEYAAIKAIDRQDPLYGQKVETAVKQWREEQLEPSLNQFTESFATPRAQEWAQGWIARTRDTMFAHSTADIATAAKIGVDNAAHTTVNTASAVAFKDPSMLQSQLDLVEHSVTGLVQSTPVKGVDAAKIQSDIMEKAKEKIVKSAIQGAILNGTPWEKIANDPRYSQYVDGGELKMFARAAETQSKANLAYSKQIEAYNRSEQRDKVETARNETWAKNVTFDDATGKPVINPQFFKDVISIPTRFPGAPNATDTARTMLDWGEAVQNGKLDKVRTDPTVQGALTAGLFRAENPTSVTDVLKAETEQKLTHTDGTVLRELINARDEAPIKDPVFKDTIQAAKDTFTFGTNSADDPMGSKAYSAFVQKFFPEYIKELRAGTLKPNALNMRDPTSLISQSIAAARPSLQDSIKTDAPRAKFVPPPGWLINSKGEYSDPAGIIYDAEGKPTGRKINANTLPSRWPTIPISQ